MSDIKQFPTAESQSSAIRKPGGRPKSPDPKVSVTLSIRRSTLECITRQLPEGQSVPWALSAAVERKYGITERLEKIERKQAENREVISRLKGKLK